MYLGRDAANASNVLVMWGVGVQDDFEGKQDSGEADAAAVVWQAQDGRGRF